MFSSAGHPIYLAGIVSNGRMAVLESQFEEGKYL